MIINWISWIIFTHAISSGKDYPSGLYDKKYCGRREHISFHRNHIWAYTCTESSEVPLFVLSIITQESCKQIFLPWLDPPPSPLTSFFKINRIWVNTPQTSNMSLHVTPDTGEEESTLAGPDKNCFSTSCSEQAFSCWVYLHEIINLLRRERACVCVCECVCVWMCVYACKTQDAFLTCACSSSQAFRPGYWTALMCPALIS